MGFTTAYFLAFIGVAIARGNSEFIFYAAVMAALIVLILLADRRVHFSNLVLWGLSIWGLLHMAGGNVPLPGEGGVLYNLMLIPIHPPILKYDQAVHCYGFFVSSFVCWEALRAVGRPAAPVRFGLAFLIACMSMGLGALNEVVEFAAVLLLPETNVGGYMNTGWDMVFNMIGACTGAAIIWAGNRAGAGSAEEPRAALT